MGTISAFGVCAQCWCCLLRNQNNSEVIPLRYWSKGYCKCSTSCSALQKWWGPTWVWIFIVFTCSKLSDCSCVPGINPRNIQHNVFNGRLQLHPWPWLVLSGLPVVCWGWGRQNVKTEFLVNNIVLHFCNFSWKALSSQWNKSTRGWAVNKWRSSIHKSLRSKNLDSSDASSDISDEVTVAKLIPNTYTECSIYS